MLMRTLGTACGFVILALFLTACGGGGGGGGGGAAAPPLAVRFFAASDGTTGVELWKTDSTDAGTVLVKDINTNDFNPNARTGSSFPLDFTVFNGVVYFAANDGTTGFELWKSDGTAAGTVLVKDINPIDFNPNTGPAGSSFPTHLTVFNGALYFGANDGTTSRLWKSDGTTDGTKPIGGGSSPRDLIVFNNALYFSAFDNTAATELWKSDGTAAGTEVVTDINPTGGSFCREVVRGITVFNGALYFCATDGEKGFELWKSNGTAAGTMLVKDINPDPEGGGSDPRDFTVFNGELYFSASDGETGRELWKSDGTEAGTELAVDINFGTGTSSGAPRFLTVFNGALYFSAFDDAAGRELWKSDGTAVGTALVKDIFGLAPGSDLTLDPGGSFPEDLTVFNGALYFSAIDRTNVGEELWKSDGTAAGTVLFKDICPGPCSGFE